MHKLISLFLLFSLVACSSEYLKESNERRYFGAIMLEQRDSNIKLNNGLLLRCDRQIINTNMEPIIFVLQGERPDGYFYLNEEKINFVLLKDEGGGRKSVRTIQNNELILENRGYADIIQKKDNNKSVIFLGSGQSYRFKELPDKNETSMILAGEEVILIPEQNNKAKYILVPKLNRKFLVEEYEEII